MPRVTRRPSVRAQLSIAMLALAPLGCSDSDSTSRSEPAPPAPSEETTTRSAVMPAAAMCELPSGGYASDCNGCLEASCCEDVEACKADAECAAQLTCIVECQRATEPGACSEACTPDGMHVLYTAYDDCSFDACIDTCWM